MHDHILKSATKLWYDRDADHAAATVSYYSIFAIAPLVFLTLTVMSFIYDRESVITFLNNIGAAMGTGSVSLVETATVNLSSIASNFWVPVLGAVFFSGMVVVFCNALTSGIHHVWGVPHAGFKGWVKKCRNAVTFIVAFELYLIAVFALQLTLRALTNGPTTIAWLIDQVFFVLATTVLFAIAFHILPWTSTRLQSRLIGGFVASVLLVLVKVAVGWYLTISPFPGLFEVAGALIVILMWIYSAASVFYFGAAVTHVVEGEYNKHHAKTV